jgi:molecular chaperone DnaK (HSP70)
MAADSETRAFLTWIAHVLHDADIRVTDLPDLKSGVVLIRLAEHLFHETIPPKFYRAEPKREFDMILNCNYAIEFLQKKGVKMVGISGKDVFDLNVRPLFGLLANLCFNYNIEAPPPPPPAGGRGDPLLAWVKSTLEPRGITVKDFSGSWSDGLAFYSLIAIISPGSLDFAEGSALSPADRERQGLAACERLGIPVYAEPGSIATPKPSSNVIKMQIQEIYKFSASDAPHRPPPEPIPTPRPDPPKPSISAIPAVAPLPRAEVHLPPEGKSEHSIGIDFGASKIRFGVFSKRNPESAFDVNVLDPIVGVDAAGKLFVGDFPELTPIPPVRELVGRQFNDPSASESIKAFPVPIFEHPESHTCALNLNGHGVTPESVTAALFDAVKATAKASTGEEVCDASIAVPTMFSSLQREAIRDAAESVGLRISHITSGSVMAARAMKVSGELSEPGLSVIVDIGASKTEVSLIHNDDDGVREVRTAGSDKIGGNQVRDAVVERVLPVVKKKAAFVSPALRAKLQAQAEVAIATDGHIRVSDIGNGESIEVVVTQTDIAACCAKVADGVKELVSEVVSKAEIKEVHCVRCIGGGTNLPVLKDAVQTAFPEAELRQFDPDELISCGATLDGADRTNRLPQNLKTRVVTVAPYSIGISMLGDVIVFLIQRGQALPAMGETGQVTSVDYQKIVTFHVWQGEHVLMELSNPIGKAVLEDLPPLPRGKCKLVCRIEYNDDGILQFSASEQTTGKSVHSQFTAKTEFTDADRARLTVARPHDAIEELRIAEVRLARADFVLDIERAEKQSGSSGFSSAVDKWRKWFDANETGPYRLFIEKQNDMRTEFWRLNQAQWEEPGEVATDAEFREIWPCGPVVTSSGSGIIRFLATARVPSVSVTVENIDTHATAKDYDVCQFMNGPLIESVVRVYFPENGKYKVTVFAGTVNGTLSVVHRTGIGRGTWRFDVSGCPGPRRPLCQLITGRTFMPLPLPDTLRITPASSCVYLPGTQYNFSVAFRGELAINGREPLGAEKQTFFPKVVAGPPNGGYENQDCVITFPARGAWRVMFWVDQVFAGTQVIVAAASLEPTDEERIALSASLDQ